MSVQRWDIAQIARDTSDGAWVTYADHARIVAEMEQAHAAALAAEQRQRDVVYRTGLALRRRGAASCADVAREVDLDRAEHYEREAGR